VSFAPDVVSEVTTLRRYTNLFIIIIIISESVIKPLSQIYSVQVVSKLIVIYLVRPPCKVNYNQFCKPRIRESHIVEKGSLKLK